MNRTNNVRDKTLVVGIGSPHGDDQAGWKVIEQLELRRLPGVELRRAAVPHDLIDWIGEHTELHIIDGCATSDRAGHSEGQCHERFAMVGDATGGVRSLQFKDSRRATSFTTSLERPLQLRSVGSHHIDVFAVLELAACLDLLPEAVVVWAIPGEQFSPCAGLTILCERAISSCVEQLSRELDHT
jgi:Ni,Fe-hydrogenase maturation factor